MSLRGHPFKHFRYGLCASVTCRVWRLLFTDKNRAMRCRICGTTVLGEKVGYKRARQRNAKLQGGK
jgi:hypothetical protein